MSCLFIAIGRALRVPHATLRQDVCHFIETTNPSVMDTVDLHTWIRVDSGLDAAAYARRMSQPHEWGGAIEIWCATRMYDINVTVRYNGTCIQIGDGTKNVQLGYTGSHYTLC